MLNNQLPLKKYLQVPKLIDIPDNLKALLKDQTVYIDNLIVLSNKQNIKNMTNTCYQIKYTNLQILDILKIKNYSNKELENWIRRLDTIIEAIF